MSHSLPEIVHLASRGCIIDMVLKEILVMINTAKTYRRLGGGAYIAAWGAWGGLPGLYHMRGNPGNRCLKRQLP